MKEKVLSFLQREIDLEHIPGATISVSYKGKTVLEQAIGNSVVYPEKREMSMDTVFDLASLTKVVATLPLILRLLDEGEIRLDDPVTYFLPEFAQHGKDAITIRHLLTHTSALPAYKPFYLEALKTEQILGRIYAMPIVYPIESKVTYSDLGFIILYHLIEKITNVKFEKLVQQELFTPLDMSDTGFNPTFKIERYAATEFSEKHNTYKIGITHDENAESMGGISGHAGLFSTLHDLQNYATMIENHGVYNGKQILSEAVLKLARSNYTRFDKEFRGLGWILKSPTSSSCGDLFSEHSYGHTGFTGTSIWFDPEIDLHVILLTNRVHFGRQPHILRLRPRLHNLIRSEL